MEAKQIKISGRWHGPSHVHIYCIGLRRGWRFGVDHGFYDCPHTVVDLGPLYAMWSSNNWPEEG